jgi:hypothetical protein
MPVSFSDRQLAFEFVTSGGMGENEAYLVRQLGKIYWHSEFATTTRNCPAPCRIVPAVTELLLTAAGAFVSPCLGLEEPGFAVAAAGRTKPCGQRTAARYAA